MESFLCWVLAFAFFSEKEEEFVNGLFLRLYCVEVMSVYLVGFF